MEKQNEILISVCVAVYQVEDQLPDCIESLIKEKYANVEIILVDDGSKDRSGVLCDEYAARDPRIHVIHQKNGGLSAARNAGIDAAVGKWLTFVDGDDMLAEHALSTMLQAADDPSDLVLFDYVPFSAKECVPQYHAKEQGKWYRTADELTEYKRRTLHGSLLHVTAWAKMIKRDFLNRWSIRFPLGVNRAQDAVFTSMYIKHLTMVHYVPACVYLYYINESGITYKFSPNIIELNGRYLSMVYDELRNESIEGKEELLGKRCIHEVDVALRNGAYHPNCHWNRRKRMRWLWELQGQFWTQNALEQFDGSEKVGWWQKQAIKYLKQNRLSRMDSYCMWNSRIKKRLKKNAWINSAVEVARKIKNN